MAQLANVQFVLMLLAAKIKISVGLGIAIVRIPIKSVKFLDFIPGVPKKKDIENHIFGVKSHLQKSHLYLLGGMQI